MRVDLKLEVPVEITPRVVQLSGIFDLPEKKLAGVEFHFDVPLEEKPWQVGLILGPSGAGKSSVARHLFKDAIVEGYDWHPSRSVVDSFGDESVKEVTAALSSVGFSSPPSWVKPFRVLSNGEQFRATMARALMDPRPLIVIDEFTSVVDRTVGRIGAHALAKAVRAKPGKQFVAVTCHDDVLDWLQPDWVIEPHVGGFNWRSLQRRPPVELEIARVHPAAWKLFAPHHYLTAEMNTACFCFVATIDGKPVALSSWLPFFGSLGKNKTPGRRGHRTVCLPDYQGLGIGNVIVETIASMWTALGFRAFAPTAHPALIGYRRKHRERWTMIRAPGFTSRDTGTSKSSKSYARSRAANRRTASFEYVGKRMAVADATRLVGS